MRTEIKNRPTTIGSIKSLCLRLGDLITNSSDNIIAIPIKYATHAPLLPDLKIYNDRIVKSIELYICLYFVFFVILQKRAKGIIRVIKELARLTFPKVEAWVA